MAKTAAERAEALKKCRNQKVIIEALYDKEYIVREEAIRRVKDHNAFMEWILNGSFTIPVGSETLWKKIDELERLLDNPSIKDSGRPFEGVGHDIRFENVRFSYKEDEVIHGITLDIKEGQMVALVGESGSGKSTLAKLLVHFYDVDSGRITLGGQDLTDLRTEDLNDQISFVSQEPFLFNTSLYGNILIGKPTASREEVLHAACP